MTYYCYFDHMCDLSFDISSAIELQPESSSCEEVDSLALGKVMG